jgi:hypothetical protein
MAYNRLDLYTTNSGMEIPDNHRVFYNTGSFEIRRRIIGHSPKPMIAKQNNLRRQSRINERIFLSRENIKDI